VIPDVIARAVAEAPDPVLARVTMSRVSERPGAGDLLARPDIISGAASLLGFSRAAADFFVAHPEELASLAELRVRSKDELLSELETDVSRLGVAPGLRRFRRRAAYRVAARDLSGSSVEEVMRELSLVAEACLQVATSSVLDTVGLAVVAMGKLGGQELNYASDVDVLFLHAEPGAEAQQAASRAAARVVSMLGEPTSEGLALRVDADLRPGGRSAPLSRSLAAMFDHYERHAATWERQALLKARAVAGDGSLGRRFVEGVAPSVFPAILSASAIGDVRWTKARIEELVRNRGKEAVEVKRGRGGIRDVEFAVQLLQLVHGRRYPGLRAQGTLAALAALGEEGLVSPEDADALRASYGFLRTLEHRLQMVRDLQTHELPGDPSLLEPIARAMGLRDPADLLAQHARHTETVRGLHDRLFYRPLLEALAGPAEQGPGRDRAATEELLAGLGFVDPRLAYDAFERVVDPTTRLGRVLGALFPVVAAPLAFAAAPDAALVRFERVTERFLHEREPLPPSNRAPVSGGAGEASSKSFADRLADTLADRPDAARRLAALVAVSSTFADALVARPTLVRSLMEVPPPEAPLFPGDAEGELLRSAGAFAAGDLKVPDIGRRIATVADGVVAQALSAAAPEVPMAVVGLGRLGGEELSFASDLDVMFVYDGEGPTDFEAACRAAERILAAIRQAGWQADADLRPEGRSGPLARSLVSYLEYWERWAETWEYQALLRTRAIAGDERLGRRFLSNAADFAYPEALTTEQLVAIRRMRVRIEEERVRPREARRFHFKLGYGSLADVQFAVELALMRHGAAHPEVRRRHTLEALEALAAARLIEDSVASSLAAAYVFLTEVKCWLELERRISQGALPPAPESQAALARRLGYGEAARHRFLQDYRSITRRARLAMERVFYEEDR
jgi:glutamate-ammonia-ligase adenylyltransferase